MEIELIIDGKKKTFTTPFIPMLARRKFFEFRAKIEQKEDAPTVQETIEEEDEMYSILTDVVFKGQFTLEQLYEGADRSYIDQKLSEVVNGR